MTEKKYILHRIPGQIETIYLAEYPDRLLLLDGGCRCDTRRIRKYVTKRLGKRMEDITLSFVSHVHPDHAGAAPVLRKRYGIPIAAPRAIDTWYAGLSGWLQHLIDYLFAWAVVIRMGRPWLRMWYPRFVRPDFPLEDGSFLPFFEDWKALLTPGHTAHHAVLYNEGDGTLYAGDLVLKANDRWLLPVPITMPAAQKESLRRLSAMNITRMLLAHGDLQDELPVGLLDSLMPGSIRRPPLTLRAVMPLMMLPPDIRKKTTGGGS